MKETNRTDGRIVLALAWAGMGVRQCAAFLGVPRSEIRKHWPADAPTTTTGKAKTPALVIALAQMGASVNLTAELLKLSPQRVILELAKAGIIQQHHAETSPAAPKATPEKAANQGGVSDMPKPDPAPELAASTERAKRYQQKRRAIREARQIAEKHHADTWEETLRNVRQAREAIPAPDHRRTRGSITAKILTLKARGMNDREVSLELGITREEVTARRDMFCIDYDAQEAERRSRERQSITRPIVTLRGPHGHPSELWGGGRAQKAPEDYRSR